MKSGYAFILAALVLMSLGACAKKDNDELAHHHDHSHGHSHEHHAGDTHHDHDGDDEDEEGPDVIRLSPEVASRFGLKTEKSAVRDFSAVVKAGATVSASTEGISVVSAPTAGIVTISKGIDLGSEVRAGMVIATVKADAVSGGDANRVAKVELDAAKAELDRVETLYADRLVTLSEYNAAKAAYEHAKAAYSATAAAGRAMASAAGVITGIEARTGQFVEAGSPIATISSSDRLIVRAEVPIKSYRAVAGARDARAVLASDGSTLLLSELDGRRLDINSSVASTAGYVPVTFSVRNDGTLIPGQSVELFILGPSDRRMLAVPVSALYEQQGAFFVFEQLDEDCYRRLPVTIGANDGKYVEIASGLKGGENIVVTGVTAVRLAQTSGAVPEGHSHSH